MYVAEAQPKPEILLYLSIYSETEIDALYKKRVEDNPQQIA